MKSNIGIRSNVYVLNSDPAIKANPEFVRQVRGREAVLRLLQWLGIGPEPGSAGKVLSPRQLGELIWDTPCGRCGAIPEGLLTSSASPEIVFRCPQNICRGSTLRARTVLLPLALVHQLSAKFQEPIADLAHRMLGRVTKKKAVDWAGPRVPIAIKLSPTQYYLYDDGQIQQVLSELVSVDRK